MRPSSSINLTINKFNLSIYCYPEESGYDYEWERQNGELPSRVQGTNSSLLVIYNLRAEDAGEYRCTLSNSTGRISSMYMMLTVEGNA